MAFANLMFLYTVYIDMGYVDVNFKQLEAKSDSLLSYDHKVQYQQEMMILSLAILGLYSAALFLVCHLLETITFFFYISDVGSQLEQQLLAPTKEFLLEA